MCATHRKHLILVIAVFLVLLAALSTPACAEENVIKIGVLAYRGEEEALTMWTPTADYLSEQVPEYTFVIVPLDNDNIAPAVERAEVDFVTTNPGSYVGLEYKYGVSRIATLENLRQGNDYEVFGAVIFTRADRNDINDLKNLKGKSFMAVHEDAFGGWWMAWKEFKDDGIDPHREFSTLKFSGFPHDLIVYAVKDGEVDAGTVRTDTLERMAEDGLIEINEFKVLNQQHVEGFPFMLSTRLYPEWTFAKLRHAPDELSEKVAVTLLTMPADSQAARAAKCAGWTIPLDYNPVHECLKELRVGPYEEYGEVTLGEVLRQYWYDAILIIAALLLMIFTTRHVMGINKRLQYEIAERKQAEEALKQYAEELKSSNELKDLFTDILRHDLLNPAGIVKGFTEVLFNMEDDEKKLHLLEKIEKSNEKLINMIQSAAKFAKLQSVDEIDFEEKYLDSIFNDVVNNFRPMLDEKRMTLDFVAEGTYPANVNPMIEEVFANMMSNAIKYSPQESRIIVDILDSDEKWKVTVTDFGNGISDEDKPKIFTRFKRVDKSGVKGTGLGLAIVKRIIELHGGEVGVEDNPAGQGSVFWVTVGKA